MADAAEIGKAVEGLKRATPEAEALRDALAEKRVEVDSLRDAVKRMTGLDREPV